MSTTSLNPGSPFAGYRILGELGRGGMGIVYRAVLQKTPDDRTGPFFALKIVSRELASDESFMGRFRREGRAAAAVVHPNVVVLKDAGIENGIPYLVFEYASGGTLDEKLRRGALPWREAAALGAGIARGLHAVHAAGLVHRDVKPANVLLDGPATGSGPLVPKLSDFGLVGAWSSSLAVSRTLTKSGDVVGTLEYVSPEQADGQHSVTAAADLYSLGATLFALLTGRPPFEGEGYALLKKHLSERPPSPRALVPEIPESLEELVLRLLAKTPEERPASAILVAHDLERIARRSQPAASRPPRLALPIAASAIFVLGLASLLALRPWEGSAPPATPDEAPSEAAEVARLVSSAVLAHSSHDEARAISEANRAIALDAKAARAWVVRGVARAAKGEADAGLADVSHAIEVDPRCASAWAYRASLREDRGDLEGALADYGRSLELDGRVAATWANRALARRRTGDLEGALQDTSRAIELAPRNALAWTNRAELRIKRGDLAGAIDDATRAIELDARGFQGWANRAIAREKKGELEAALADCEKALELAPLEAALHLQRGMLKGAKGDPASARKDLDRAIELDPKLADAWMNRGTARVELGDLDGALADLDRAVELDPGRSLARYNRGTARDRKGDLDGALDDYAEALRLEPRAYRVRLARSRLLARKKDLDGSIAELTKGIELDAKNPELYFARADRRRMAGDFKGTVDDAEAALRLEPRMAVCILLRGIGNQSLGRNEEAIADFERFLELAPNDPQAGVARKALEKLKK